MDGTGALPRTSSSEKLVPAGVASMSFGDEEDDDDFVFEKSEDFLRQLWELWNGRRCEGRARERYCMRFALGFDGREVVWMAERRARAH